MAGMTIPKPVQEGLEKLQALDDNSAQALLSALQKIEPALRQKTLIHAVASQVTELDEQSIVIIYRSLASLYSYRHLLQLTVRGTVAGVLESKDLVVSEKEREKFAERLGQFLNIPALSVTAKAVEVMQNHHNVLDEVQILTDVRPVFSDDSTDIPAAALILHTLKITHRRGRNRAEFFVAMDTEDINDLRKALDRADAKAASLKKVLSKAELPYLEVEYEI